MEVLQNILWWYCYKGVNIYNITHNLYQSFSLAVLQMSNSVNLCRVQTRLFVCVFVSILDWEKIFYVRNNFHDINLVHQRRSEGGVAVPRPPLFFNPPPHQLIKEHKLEKNGLKMHPRGSIFQNFLEHNNI